MKAIPAGLLFLGLAAATLLIWQPSRSAAAVIEAGLLMVAAGVVLRNACRGQPPSRGAGCVLLGAAVGWVGVLTAAGCTVYRFASLEALSRWMVLLAIYLTASSLLSGSRSRRWFLDAFLYFGVVVSALAVVQHPTSEGRFLWWFDSGYPDLLGPFQNRNNFAAFVELLVPLALWRAARSRENRVVWLGVTAALVAAVVAASSRAGFVIVAGEVVVVLVSIRWSGILPDRLVLRTGVLVATMSVAATLVVGTDVLWKRAGDPDPLGHRPEIAGATLEMIAERPWTGFGVGTFETVYPAFARFDIGQVVNHAHNDWLEWAAEGGIPFLLLLSVFAAWHLRPAFRSVWGIGVAAVFVHALVDYPLQRVGVAGWVVFMLAAVAAEQRDSLSLDDAHGPEAGHFAG